MIVVNPKIEVENYDGKKINEFNVVAKTSVKKANYIENLFNSYCSNY